MNQFGYPEVVEELRSCQTCRWKDEGKDKNGKIIMGCTSRDFVFANTLHPLMHVCDSWMEEKYE